MHRLIIFLALTSCISTEVIGFEPIELADTTTKAKPHKPLPPRDTTSDERVPIDWNPTVDDWESADTTNIEI
jgi:hypothetical protein